MSGYDILAPEVRANPYPFYSRLRREAPVAQVEPFGLWIVTRFADVVDVLARVDEFSSRGNLREEPALLDTDDPAEEVFRPGSNIITSDNPTHDRLRAIMQKRFTPQRLAKLQPRVEALTRELLGAMLAAERFDMVRDFTVPLPVIVIAELLGIEIERRDDFKRWSDAVVQVVNGISPELREKGRGGVKELATYLWMMTERRQTQPGDDDLIDTLVRAEREPGRISAREVLSYCVLLLAAGNETTTNLIGGMVHALLKNPAQLELLQRNPDLVPKAVEEGLRYCSPVQGLFRRTLREARVGGVTLPVGAEVMVCYASANHDEARFPDPERFDITRETAGHVAFGRGLHFCLGANLARREARVAIRKLLPILSKLERLDEREEWVDSWFLRGPKKLEFRRAA